MHSMGENALCLKRVLTQRTVVSLTTVRGQRNARAIRAINFSAHAFLGEDLMWYKLKQLESVSLAGVAYHPKEALSRLWNQLFSHESKTPTTTELPNSEQVQDRLLSLIGDLQREIKLLKVEFEVRFTELSRQVTQQADEIARLQESNRDAPPNSFRTGKHITQYFQKYNSLFPSPAHDIVEEWNRSSPPLSDKSSSTKLDKLDAKLDTILDAIHRTQSPIPLSSASCSPNGTTSQHCQDISLGDVNHVAPIGSQVCNASLTSSKLKKTKKVKAHKDCQPPNSQGVPKQVLATEENRDATRVFPIGRKTKFPTLTLPATSIVGARLGVLLRSYAASLTREQKKKFGLDSGLRFLQQNGWVDNETKVSEPTWLAVAVWLSSVD